MQREQQENIIIVCCVCYYTMIAQLIVVLFYICCVWNCGCDESDIVYVDSILCINGDCEVELLVVFWEKNNKNGYRTFSSWDSTNNLLLFELSLWCFFFLQLFVYVYFLFEFIWIGYLGVTFLIIYRSTLLDVWLDDGAWNIYIYYFN